MFLKRSIRGFWGSTGSEEDLEASRPIDISQWPHAITPSIKQPAADTFLHSLRASDEHLDIKVGRGKKTQRWKAHKALICHYSEFFERACRKYSGAGFQESLSGVFDLSHDNPIAFGLFIDWLYDSNKSPQNFKIDKKVDSEVWKYYAEDACILANKLFATDFSKFSLSKLIQNAHTLDIHSMEYIYEETLPTTPVRLFCAQWACWRCSSRPTLWESTRNLELRKDRRYLHNRIAEDPRRYEIEHWYSDCGRTGSPCSHATVQTGSALSSLSLLFRPFSALATLLHAIDVVCARATKVVFHAIIGVHTMLSFSVVIAVGASFAELSHSAVLLGVVVETHMILVVLVANI
ncbi:hypothetical protein AOQ84DRAFT_377688 [Glonium stellatum]|uniref:BTB domain-containing protein n=1 Tax=Glonium stellatum TaxID=574774 RepID=A0A8E2JSE1_9PEZI|nr:hypothetical protein AOQ84DRAFT_377688 [Glonium stellatum]